MFNLTIQTTKEKLIDQVYGLDLHFLQGLSRSELDRYKTLLTPKLTKYIPHTPTAKQSAFLLLDCPEAFYGGAAGGGKALALDTPILTKTGWKQFGNLTLEDEVLAIDGTWTGIEYITEVQENHVCYAITFSNGECITADEEHLWMCCEYKNRKYWQETIKTTKDLQVKDKLVKAEAVQGAYLDMDIDPYIFGYWLGNGNAKTGSITVCDEDRESLERFCVLHAYASMPMQYTVVGLTEQLRKLGVLRNKTDNRQTAPETKHIPVNFFSASFEQRLTLLQGLMDSDGSIQERGRCEIGLKETQLANDVCTLLSSLGIVYSQSIANTRYKDKDCPSYRITFSTTLPVFRLPRKLRKIPTKVLQNRITVKSIEKVPSVPVKCIRITHPSHTFLVGRTLLPTHNSDALLMAALQYVDVKGYNAILFRKTFADLSKPEALIDRARQWLTPFIHTGEVKWNDKEKAFYFYDAYGKHRDVRSRLQFGYLENENDKYNYQGGEYQFCGFDELCHMSESNYLYLFSRMRRLVGVDIPLRARGASNPPGVGQGRWIYDRFVNPKTVKPGTIFIPAGLDDNPFIDRESYEEGLDKLDPVTRAQLRDGNWTISRTGNMFKEEWFEIVHSIPPDARQVRFWDLACTRDPKVQANRNKDPDYTAGAKVYEYRGIFYIADLKHGRWSSLETQNIQKSAALEDGVSCPIREEQEPGSSGDSAIALKNKFLLQNFNYMGVRSTGSKIQRAEYASSMAEKRRIKILATCPKREELLSELCGFPEADHDDIVDAISGAINYLASSMDMGALPEQVAAAEDSYWAEDKFTEGSAFGADLDMDYESEESDSYWLDS